MYVKSIYIVELTRIVKLGVNLFDRSAVRFIFLSLRIEVANK